VTSQQSIVKASADLRAYTARKLCCKFRCSVRQRKTYRPITESWSFQYHWRQRFYEKPICYKVRWCDL